MEAHCDCIVPFYNEELRPLYVVEALLKMKNLSNIIVVDDGSADKTTYLKLKVKFPQVISIRLDKNRGKSGAIEEGLKHSTSGLVLLVDGDLSNIKPEEFEKAITQMSDNHNVDMIIFRRVEDKTVVVSRWIRHDVIYSGQRILRKRDLEKVYKMSLSGYQIEVAINTYMMRNKKNVFWMPSSIHNSTQWTKWGLFEGTRRSLNMFKGFVKYAGWR